MKKHLRKFSIFFMMVLLCMTADTGSALASPNLETINPNVYTDKQFKDNTEYLHNDPLLEKRESLPDEQKLLNFLPKNYDANEEIKNQLFQDGFEEHKTTAYESTKLLLFTNNEKEVIMQTNETPDTIANTTGIRNLYIGILLGLILLMFFILVPLFIRGTKKGL